MTSPSGNDMLKLSPTSLDLGYHTMVTTIGSNDSPPPFREPPPPAPPSRLIRVDSRKLRVSYKKTSQCPFDVLSDDLVLKIFHFLPKDSLCQCAQLCRRFYVLAWAPQLWSHIDLTTKKADEAWTSLVKRRLSHDLGGHIVQRIRLLNSQGFSDKGLEVICHACPNLTHFEVKNCKDVTNAGVRKLLLNCHVLSHLELPGKQGFC